MNMKSITILSKIKRIVLTTSVVWISSCNTLDVPPLNVIGDAEAFTSEAGVKAYLSSSYHEVPVWQFHGGSLAGSSTMVYSGEIVGPYADGSNVGSTSFHRMGWYIPSTWDYATIRRINYFLEEFPKYASSFPAGEANTYKAEAYMMRAFRYFEMAKRFGGVPLVKRVMKYPEESAEEMAVPRSKEAEVYDFVLEDIDAALSLFNDDVKGPTGHFDKWTALALKSRVGLYAGSIAKYGPRYELGHLYKGGLTGVPTERASEYFKIAADAGAAIVASGNYELYKAKYPDKALNFWNIFWDSASKESIFSVYYTLHNNATMFDANNRPRQNSRFYDGLCAPPLEVLERYEDANTGQLFILDESKTGTNAAPKLYKNTYDIFETIEPRLKGTMILPGAEFCHEDIEVRYGIVPPGGTLNDLITSGQDYQMTVTYDGVTMYVQGASGIGNLASTGTGLHNRKWLDPELDKALLQTFIQGALTPWIEFRYAEILLNIAEAGVELKELGDASKMAEAADCINQIRDRAGAFNKNFNASTLTVADVRSERRKELYYENKTYWDLVRWRTAHEEINQKRWNIIKPIYFWDGDGDKHYYMQRDSASQNYRNTFNQQFYYQAIPGTERNPNLELNPGY
jgi:hypothetical protein